MAATGFWKQKTFAIITGASRGIGKSIAEKLANSLAPQSVLLLLSRDEQSLVSIKNSISVNHPDVDIVVGATDLSTCSEVSLNEIIVKTLSNYDPLSFGHTLCIHNAGSLGDASKRCADITQMDECMDYFRLNLTSVMVLNALFLRLLPGTRKTIVNISSLCAVEPFASLSFYCSGKAARDMFFKVLAKEEPDVRVLNYAPGPVETSMRTQISDQSWDSGLAEMMKSPALTPETTVARLMHILSEDQFKSGAHVDYYDPDPSKE